VAKSTATLGNGLPDESRTRADTVTVPPFWGTLDGATLIETLPTAALPTLT